jgi:hypothetical protein
VFFGIFAKWPRPFIATIFGRELDELRKLNGEMIDESGMRFQNEATMEVENG